MRAVDVEPVGTRAQPDVEILGLAVIHAGFELEPAQGIGSQLAGLAGRVGRIVDIDGVIVKAAVYDDEAVDTIDAAHRVGSRRRQRRRIVGRQCRRCIAEVEAVVVRLAVEIDGAAEPGRAYVDDIVTAITIQGRVAPGPGPVDDERVVVGLAIDHQLIGDVVDADGIGAVAGVYRRVLDKAPGRSPVRAVNGEDVSLGTKADVQRLDRAVANASGHIQAGDGSRREVTRVGVGIASIVDIQGVAAAQVITVHRQQRADAVHRAAAVAVRGRRRALRHAAHIDRIGTIVAIHRGRATDRAHVDDIVTAITIQGRVAPGPGPVDDERVVVGLAIDHQLIGDVVDADGIGAVPGVQGHVAPGPGPIDDERVVVGLAIDYQLIGNAVDDDGIGTVAGVHRRVFDKGRGRSPVRAVDSKGIAVGSERNDQVLDVDIADASRRQAEAIDHRSG